MKKTEGMILFGFLLILFNLPIGYSAWCYQETANVSTACGGLNSGSYSVESTWLNENNLIDGDWDTSSYMYTGGNIGKIYVNYSIPKNILAGNKWQIKFVNIIYPYELITINLSIPKSCFIKNKVQFIIESNFGYIYEEQNITFYCKTRKSEIKLYTYQAIGGLDYIYEEAMWWNIKDAKKAKKK